MTDSYLKRQEVFWITSDQWLTHDCVKRKLRYVLWVMAGEKKIFFSLLDSVIE